MIYYANENSQYIKHYGVLGMKWGHHRYKSMIKKSNKLRTKNKIAESNKLKSKAELYKQGQIAKSGGKKAYDYTMKQSLGKTFVKSAIIGTYGTLKYNQFRAKGNGRAKSLAFGAVNEIGNTLTRGALSFVWPRTSSEYKKYKADKKAKKSAKKSNIKDSAIYFTEK